MASFYHYGNQQACPMCGYNVVFTWRMEKLARMDQPYDGRNLETCRIVETREFPVCRKCGYVHGLEDADDEMQQYALSLKEEMEIAVREEAKRVEEAFLESQRPQPVYLEEETVTPIVEDKPKTRIHKG